MSSATQAESESTQPQSEHPSLQNLTGDVIVDVHEETAADTQETSEHEAVSNEDWLASLSRIQTIAFTRVYNPSFPYFSKLGKEVLTNSSNFSLLDFAGIGFRELLHSAGGSKLANSYDESDPVIVKLKQDAPETVHVIDLDGAATTRSSSFWLGEPQAIPGLRNRLQETTDPNGSALRLVIVTGLSPVTIEIVGHALDIDPQVFVKHVWTNQYWPWEFSNKHENDYAASLEDPPNTMTVDCDIDVASERRNIESFFRPKLFPWPFFLSMGLFRELNRSTSRFTMHVKPYETQADIVLVLCSPMPTHSYTAQTITRPAIPQDAQGVPVRLEDATVNTGYHPLLASSLARHTDWNGIDPAHPVPAGFNNLLSSFSTGLRNQKSSTVTTLLWLSTSFIRALDRLHVEDTRRLKRGVDYRNKVKDPYTSTARQPLQEAADRETLALLRILHERFRSRLSTLMYLEGHIRHALATEVPDAATQTTLHSVIEDFAFQTRKINSALEQLAAEQAFINEDLQKQLSLLQIEESRKSIQQNEAVRKITILAFIFIPLQAVSGIMGMNVVELLSTPPSIWVFFLTAALVTLSAVLIASYSALRHFAYGIVDALRGTESKTSQRACGIANTVTSPLRNWVLAPFKALVIQVRYLHARGKQTRAQKMLVFEQRRKQATEDLSMSQKMRFKANTEILRRRVDNA